MNALKFKVTADCSLHCIMKVILFSSQQTTTYLLECFLNSFQNYFAIVISETRKMRTHERLLKLTGLRLVCIFEIFSEFHGWLSQQS
jgi:hypothetical protein